MFVRAIVNIPFRTFDRSALDEKDNAVLDGGIVKHRSILRATLLFLLPKCMLAIIAPEIYVLLSAVSFISMMLGTAWYTISFQNVSDAQLLAGVADFITKKMFRAFVLSFDTLIICAITFVTKMLLPELLDLIPEMRDIGLGLRIILLVTNVSWLKLVLIDVYFASVCYDAADSLLGDGFPTLMRGAKANAQNLPLLKALRVMIQLNVAACKQQGINIDDIPDINELFQNEND